jgi:Small-conductance mechanosensitive channel
MTPSPPVPTMMTSHKTRKSTSLLESKISQHVSTLFDNDELAHMTPFESTFPFVARIIGSPSQARNLIAFLRQETSDLRQIVIFATVGYSIPMVGNLVAKKLFKMDQTNYAKTRFFHVINHISQGFKLGAFTTLIETICEMILGLETEITAVLTNTVSSVIFSIWGMYRVKWIKNLFVANFFKRMHIKNKRVQRLYEKLSDFVLYLVTFIIVLDTLGFKYQTALKSISVFGGLGTIVFSLASKDMSVQLLSGLSMQITQQFDVGDELQLEGGELGTVESMGLLHTYIRGHDEVVTKISNAELENMRVSNLSLGSTSQVKQILRFQFSALHNAGELVEEIKSQIKQTTDKLITDGSRPFRVHWTGFGEEWLEVTVDCRLNIPPLTDEYYDTRQKILQAIARASEKCHARFAED